MAVATGSHSNRQRRVRHPTASSSTAAATAWIVAGTQPCINDVCWPDSSGAATLVIEPVTPSIVVSIVLHSRQHLPISCPSATCQSGGEDVWSLLIEALPAGTAACRGCCGR